MPIDYEYSNSKEYMAKQTEEVHRNCEYFRTILDRLLKNNRDEFVVIKNRNILGYFKSYSDARAWGEENIDDGIYSIQEITDEPIDIPHLFMIDSNN